MEVLVRREEEEVGTNMAGQSLWWNPKCGRQKREEEERNAWQYGGAGDRRTGCGKTLRASVWMSGRNETDTLSMTTVHTTEAQRCSVAQIKEG